MSLVSLNTNRFRSFLTILGIIIGISAVIIIMSVGAGAQSLILNQIEKVGSNLIGILPGASDENGPPASAMGIQVTTLKDEDALAMQRRLSQVIAVCSYVSGQETISWQNQKKDAQFLGTSASYQQVEDSDLIKGSFFSEQEENSVARTAALGYQLALDLFGQTEPIGQQIKIKRENFTVIGVFEKRGKVAFQDPDNQAFIPLSTAQKILLGIKHVNLIRVKVASQASVAPVIEEIKQVLRERHDLTGAGEDDFSVRDQAEAIEALKTITDALSFFLAAMAGISLIVGGIGIMNIMYVSVTERTREIGLRKAVGATNRSVLGQFLTESILITLLGGAFGILLGAGISGAVAAVANYLGYEWQYIVTTFSIMLGLGVSGSVGILFGYFPAKAASALNPIEALRYE